jgi:molybdopterin synthase catalytic subunit
MLSALNPTDHPTNQLRLSFAPLDREAVYNLAADPSNGAVVMMSGTVRNQTAGRRVEFLEYQAYEPMARDIFYRIANRIRQNWPETNNVVIHHRLGRLAIGEISVLVAVGCPHRAEAFSACQFAIDMLKHHAPIWKKEHWQDGASDWVSIGACEQADCPPL